MTYTEFKNKYLGKAVDFDGHYGPQCMDLYRQYVKEVLNAPQSQGVTGAYEVWDTYLPQVFERISNTPEGVPQQGDVVIWSKSASLPYGHISMFDNGDANSFVSLDQNWPVGALTKLVSHSYSGVKGWLRPLNMNDTIPVDKKTFEDLVTKASKYDEFYKAGFQTVEQVLQSIQDRDRTILGLREERDTAKSELEARRKANNAFVAVLADDDHLQTRQDENEIISKAKTFGTIEAELEDTITKYSSDKKSWALTEQELKAEIARLKALLATKNVLENTETKVLLKEILNRLLAALDRSKK